jgi:hypothetical protein
MSRAGIIALVLGLAAPLAARQGRPIMADGAPAALDVRAVGAHAVRITLVPTSTGTPPSNPPATRWPCCSASSR